MCVPFPSPVLTPPVYSGRTEVHRWKCGGVWAVVLCLTGVLGVFQHTEGKHTVWTTLPSTVV